MPFVHSLVRTVKGKKEGWCAPVEVGEASPHYISFVVPIVDGRTHERYACEVVRTSRDGDKIAAHDMIREGGDSFVLKVADKELWFTVRSVARKERCLPYVGSLKHPDFTSPFIEIEPEDPSKLDQLFEDENVIVVGCDPTTHYGGDRKVMRQTQAS
jgi:hypothetical protein